MVAARSDDPVSIGDVVAGKYRVERLIGRGGMGCVYRATHVELLQPVALKFLSSAALEQEDARARFLREARAAAALTTEHVARVLDVGVLDDGVPYLVIEYLDGEELAARIARGPVPVDEAVEIVMQACEALGVAHRLEIVHRDVKPQNIFLVRRARGGTMVKILDFGIAKVERRSEDTSGSLTGTAAVMGTPHYMAPEQMASSRDATASADVWALGVCLYECLAGRRPFETGKRFELAAIVMDEAVPLATHRTDVPAALLTIVDRCLQKDPLRRYTDANELYAALDAAVQHGRVVVSPTLVMPSFAPPLPQASQPSPPPPRSAPASPIATATSFHREDGNEPSAGGKPMFSRGGMLVPAGLLVVLIAAGLVARLDRHRAASAAPKQPVPAMTAISDRQPPPKPSATSVVVPALPAAPTPIASAIVAPSATAATTPSRATGRDRPHRSGGTVRRSRPTTAPIAAATAAPAER